MLLASYERDAIRPHVLGKFKDLLLATARHPAMLYYLDNWESMSPDAFDVDPVGPSPRGQNLAQIFSRQAHGLNENYGRELMELHTLGVNGGYTQEDVIAVARCFTGWTIREPSTKPEFVFAGFMHDTGEKTVLGHKIAAGGGEQDGLQVIDILAHHPSTAKFISRKLAQRFVADDPPQSLVDRMAQTFTKTDGDLRAVMETMFTSPEFFSEGAWQAKMKSPFEMVVSAVRALGGEATDTLHWRKRSPIWASRSTASSNPRDIPKPARLAEHREPDGPHEFCHGAGIRPDSGREGGQRAVRGQGRRGDRARSAGPAASEQTAEALEKGLEGKEPTARMVASLVISSPDFQRR